MHLVVQGHADQFASLMGGIRLFVAGGEGRNLPAREPQRSFRFSAVSAAGRLGLDRLHPQQSLRRSQCRVAHVCLAYLT